MMSAPHPARPLLAMKFLLLVLSALLLSQGRAATSCAADPDFYRFTFGKFVVTVIQDGLLTFPANPFLVLEQLVKRSFFFYNPSSDPYSITQNVVLLQRGADTILVDSGSGKAPSIFGTAGKLVENMRAAGVTPESVTHVILTHGHIDHVGGIANLDGTATFPNAKLILSRREFNFWNSPPEDIISNIATLPPSFTQTLIQVFKTSTLPYESRTVLVDDKASVVPGIEMFHTPGHTPGHMSVKVRSGGKALFIIGDAFLTRATNIQNPDWNINSDTNGTEAIETRTKLLNFLANKKHLVLAYHNAFPGLGHVHHYGPFFDWSPFVQLG